MKKKIIIGTLVASIMIATGCGAGAKVNTTEGEVTETQAQSKVTKSNLVNMGNKTNELFQTLDNLYSTMNIKGILKQFGNPMAFTVHDVTDSSNLYYCQLQYNGFEINAFLDQSGYTEVTSINIYTDMTDYVGGFKLGTTSNDLVGTLRGQYGVLPKSQNVTVGCVNANNVDVTYDLGIYDIQYSFLGEPNSYGKPVTNTETLNEITIYKPGVTKAHSISPLTEDMELYCFTSN